jgi:Dolichyl-phosphate-mannose-protein mannosyltransferase
MPVMGHRRSVDPLGVLVVAAAVAGLALRIAVHRSSLGVIDGDEAVWGLMARHVLDGEFTAFYWGQSYGGTQEVLLTAPLFGVFGTSVLAMRAVPVALTAVAAVLVWRIGRRTIGEPAASAAALLFWVWPPYLIWKSVRAHGFYGSGIVLAGLVLLLVLRLGERRSRLDFALLGLVLGLGCWQTPQIVPVALPALAWLMWRRPSAWREAWPAPPAFLVGALPWIYSNIAHGWWSFTVSTGDTPYVLRLRGFFSSTLPMVVGLRIPFTSEWPLGPVLSGVVYVAVVGLLAIAAWRTRRNPNMVLLSSVAAAYPFLYALSPATWLVDEPRYVVMLLPVAVLLLAQPLTTFGRGALAVVGAIAFSSLVLIQVASSPEYDRRADGQYIPRDFAPLVAELDRRGLARVYSNYWIAYRLDFETRERIIAAEALLYSLAVRGGTVAPRVPTRPDDNRYKPYDTKVRATPSSGYVLLRDSADEARARPLLEANGYARTVLDRFVIYQPKASP